MSTVKNHRFSTAIYTPQYTYVLCCFIEYCFFFLCHRIVRQPMSNCIRFSIGFQRKNNRICIFIPNLADNRTILSTPLCLLYIGRVLHTNWPLGVHLEPPISLNVFDFDSDTLINVQSHFVFHFFLFFYELLVKHSVCVSIFFPSTVMLRQ